HPRYPTCLGTYRLVTGVPFLIPEEGFAGQFAIGRSSKTVQALRQFDGCAPRIGELRAREALVARLAVGLIEFHAVCLQLLAKSLQVLDFETYVVERPPFGRQNWHSWCFGEDISHESCAGNVSNQVVAK